MRLQLETGRTHQLRVHMAHIKHPIVGDPAYGRAAPIVKQTNHIDAAISCFPRQALHAVALGLNHPWSGLAMEWTAQLPEDMFELVRVIQSGGDSD